MEFLNRFRQWIFFVYYTEVKGKEKTVLLVASLLFITVTSAIASSIFRHQQTQTVTSAETAISQNALLTKLPRVNLTTQDSVASLSPTISLQPTSTPLPDETTQLLKRVLESEWQKINTLPEGSSKVSLNAKAAEVSLLLRDNNTEKAHSILASLIREVEQAIYDASVTPTLTPTITPTRIPTLTPLTGPPGSGYSNVVVNTERGKFSAKIISVDLNTAKMLTVTANNDDCSHDCPTKSLASYVSENEAFAGINGTYFCPPDYAECASKKNSFDFPVYNSRIGKWINSYNLLWNDRAIIYQDEGGLQFRNSSKTVKEYDYYYEDEGITRHYYKKKYIYYAGFSMAPGLLEGGNVIVNQYPLTDKQKAKAVKAGIGFQGSIVYAVIAYNVSMEEFAYVFKALGATYALNLDSGGSTAMWYGGYKVGPGRSLPNAIVFVKK